MLGVRQQQQPPQVRGRGVAVAARALSRPLTWRPIHRDFDMAELFIQEIKLDSNVVTVMGDSSEELAEKVMAAMLVYHQAGYLPKKLPARVVHKSDS